MEQRALAVRLEFVRQRWRNAPAGMARKMRAACSAPDLEPAQADHAAKLLPASGVVAHDLALPHRVPLRTGREPCGPQ